MTSRRGRGFTLMELMVTLAVAAVLTTIGLPSMQQVLAKRRLSAAAEELYGNLQLMRAQAIKQNRPAYVSFFSDADGWRYGLDDTAACDTSVAGDCTVHGNPRSYSSDNYRGVTLTQTFAANLAGFEPRRGLAFGSGSVTLSSSAGEVRVLLLRIGQLRLCSPAGDDKVSGYADCT